MTIRRFGIALVVLSLGYGCAEAVSLKDSGVSTGNGGSTSDAGGSTSDAGSSSKSSGGSPGNGGSTGSATGNGGTGTGTQTSASTPAGGNTGTSTKTSTSPTTTVVTPSSCDGATGELTVAHAAQAGGSGYTGTTTITPGTATTFTADAVQIKICFSTIGDVPAGLSSANMKIYHAAVEGGPTYKELNATPISVEKPDTSRFCFLFDLTKEPKASGVSITAPASLKYNWSFDSTQVTGLSLDTRPQNKPQIMVFYNAAIAACADPTPAATTTP